MDKFFNLNARVGLCILFLSLSNFVGFAQTKKLEVHAHRGGAGLYPENSIVAMLNAVAMGVRTLELDLHITADDRVVVIHDPYFTSAKNLAPGGEMIDTGSKMRHVVYELKYDVVKEYDVGIIPQKDFPTRQNIGARVPLLSQLIDEVEAYTRKYNLTPVRYNIEIKSNSFKDDRLAPKYDKFTDLAMAIINQKGIADRVIIQSFDVRTLEHMHKFYPNVALSYLVGRGGSFERDMAKLSFLPQIYSPNYKKVNQKMVERAHLWGVKVIPWTVNERGTLTYMLQVGVDGVISDYPNRMFQWLKDYPAVKVQ